MKKQEIIDYIRKTPKFELQIDGLGLKHWCFFDGEKPIILSKYLREKMDELERDTQETTRSHYYDLVIRTFANDLYKEWRKARMEGDFIWMKIKTTNAGEIKLITPAYERNLLTSHNTELVSKIEQLPDVGENNFIKAVVMKDVISIINQEK